MQINPKAWPNLKINDILEISSVNQNINAVQSSHQLSSLNRATACTNNSILNSSQTNQQQQQKQLNSSTGLLDDETSPILLQVVQGSFNEQISSDSIRIDQIGSSAPFSFKSLAYVNVTVVDKAVS